MSIHQLRKPLHDGDLIPLPLHVNNFSQNLSKQANRLSPSVVSGMSDYCVVCSVHPMIGVSCPRKSVT